MRLPQNILTKTYTKPRIFLCETDKTRICQLDTSNTSGVFKFNSYSELSFDVARVYNDLVSGTSQVNPFYDKIEALRLIELENIGYFEIQTPELSSDGIKEFKMVTANSLEYTLSQKYLRRFYVNTGELKSIEVMVATARHGGANSDTIEPVVLYNPLDPELSLLDIVLHNIPGWTIKNVDDSLRTLSRTFEMDRISVYDFLMNEICEKFNCYITFDTIRNEISVHAEAQTQKFLGDGKAKTFYVSPPFAAIDTVTVGGYKTLNYTYFPDKQTVTQDGVTTTFEAGTLILLDKEPPANNAVIEVVDGALADWETDVFVTFDNLSQEISISYDADDIKTQLIVKGADELGIEEVNLGMPYIADLSYYCTPEWMGKELYAAYTSYLKECNAQQKKYQENIDEINEFNDLITNERIRMASRESNITEVVVEADKAPPGKYFIREGFPPNCYYREVTLPKDYKAGQVYYLFKKSGSYLTETKMLNFYTVLQTFFVRYFTETEVREKEIYLDELRTLQVDFSFNTDAFSALMSSLNSISTFKAQAEVAKQDVESRYDANFIFACINRFLDTIWNELGEYPLNLCYLPAYISEQTNAAEMGWGDVSSDEYGRYLAAYLMVRSLERAIANRQRTIAEYEEAKNVPQSENIGITNGLDLNTYITSYISKEYPEETDPQKFVIRLSAFLREDEYIDDNFLLAGQESNADLYKIKRELLECGRIELNRLCQPKLQFSMSMANIYALPEFEPIIDQFQLGNVIKVALRNDYLKQSRLLQVNINFDDFSDFSCEFGELTNLKTQSDLHADLLSQAISAGKSVASNKSHWNKGTDKVNEIDLRIQRGLLDAVTSIKSMDATQSVEIDNYGIHLRKTIDDTGTNYDSEQGWLTNNKILFSNDNFKTVKSVFGKYKIDEEEYWGLLADACIASYIEGSTIRGGTMKVGYLGKDDEGNEHWMFEVDDNGSVYLCDRAVEFSVDKNSLDWAVKQLAKDIEGVRDICMSQIDDINNTKMYRAEVSTINSQIIKDKTQKAVLNCTIYSWDKDITNDYLTNHGYGSDYDGKKFSDYIYWRRQSNSSAADAIWNNSILHQGVSSITIGAEDVVHNASFYCEVQIPDKLPDKPAPDPEPEPEPEEDTNKTT